MGERDIQCLNTFIITSFDYGIPKNRHVDAYHLRVRTRWWGQNFR